MDRAEKTGLTLALILLLTFFSLIVYAAKGLKIDIPHVCNGRRTLPGRETH
ncbi:hypothetical protein [Aquifex aeolicus]|uniref:hypothetical protein n=1 Tax=Aquifex aeolicus TaxID=63363 RepID=UPI0002DBB0E2|nr:hypothetical protein [Aquifex aeolicus]